MLYYEQSLLKKMTMWTYCMMIRLTSLLGQIIEKLSTRLPSLENRMKVLQEIADVNGISLQLQEAHSTPQKVLNYDTQL